MVVARCLQVVPCVSYLLQHGCTLHMRRNLHTHAVTRGEEGQAKRLMVLESGTWARVEDIPLDIGPRYFSLGSLDLANHQVLDVLRPGDRWGVGRMLLE